MSATLLFRYDAAIDRSDVFNWTPISWEIFRSDFQSIYRDSQAGTGTFVLPAMNQRKKEPKNQILIGVYCGNQPAAFHYGSPDSAGAFRMRNTAVAQPFRGQGLYVAMLELVLNQARELGYNTVESKHRADNNAIIIPKLKAGFHITGLEIDGRAGVMVRLTYSFQDLQKEMLAFRTGSKTLSGKLAQLLPKPADDVLSVLC